MMLKDITRQWTNPESVIFALRFCLAVFLTWGLSLLMDSDATSTSMATAAIIQITGTRGAGMKKSAARLVGTFIGGAYVLFIASATLIDSWLFNSFLIVGIVTSLGIASYFHNRVAYMFAVVGITLSLVGFPIAADPDMSNLFDHVQLRCIGISFGILMAMVAAMIIPYDDDQKELSSVRLYTESFLEKLFLSDEDKATQLTRTFLVFVSKKWQLVADEIFGSKRAKQDKSNSRAAFYDSINIGILAIELKKLGDTLGVSQAMWLELTDCDFTVNSHFEAEIKPRIAQACKVEDLSLVNVFFEQVASFSEELTAFKNKTMTFDYSSKTYASDIGHFTDGYVVLNNMLRAAIALFTLSYLWIELQWQDGMSAMIMAGMVISVYAANPGAEKVQSPQLYAQFVAGLFGFIVTFGVMPIGSPWLVAVVSFLGVYLMAYWFWQSKSILKGICMVSLFSWTNLVPLSAAPTYDFQQFLNSIVANITALILLWCAFKLVPVRSTANVIKRELRIFIERFRDTSSEERQALNIGNWILAAYNYLISVSDVNSINRMLYLKALQDLLNEEPLTKKDKDTLLASIDTDIIKFKKSDDFSKFIERKSNGIGRTNYRWFSLCSRYAAL